MDMAFKMFQRKLIQNQNLIVSQLNNLERSLLTENLNDKITLSQSLQSICSNFRSDCGPDTPTWVIQLQTLTNNLVQNRNVIDHKINLLSFIQNNKDAIALHDWNSGGYKHDLNFDSIYEHYKSQSKLPELFDNLISIIEKIISEEDLELGNISKKLQFLLSVIRSNTNKSYFGDQSILAYLVFFIKEFLLNMASSIPGLKEFIEALISTANKIDREMKQTAEKTDSDIKKKLDLTDMISYNSVGLELKNIESSFKKQIDLLA